MIFADINVLTIFAIKFFNHHEQIRRRRLF